MNKLELIQELKVASNLFKSETDSVVSLFFNEMTVALTNGDRVEGTGGSLKPEICNSPS